MTSILTNSNFFSGRETVNASLVQSEKDNKFNARMIEEAYYLMNGDYHYVCHPIVTTQDNANFIMLKYLPILQERLNKKHDSLCKIKHKDMGLSNEAYQVKGKDIFEQLILNESIGIISFDIHNDEWVKVNPLTKAMLFCIKDQYDQSDINTIVSNRVMQFYEQKAKIDDVISSNDFFSACIDEIVNFVFSPAGSHTLIYADDVAVSIKEKVEEIAFKATNLSMLEIKQVDDLMSRLNLIEMKADDLILR